jgi:hypothetical protein
VLSAELHKHWIALSDLQAWNADFLSVETEMTLKKHVRGLIATLFASTAVIAPAGAYVQVAAVDNYAAYYDGFYGQVIDGYWGRDGKFWYLDRTEQWHQDDGNHFQHDPASGMKRIQGSGLPRVH